MAGNLLNWSGKQVVILGAARQGTALARYLVRHGARVRLSDLRPLEQLEESRRALADLSEREASSIDWVCGEHPLSLLDNADLLCLSGGVPLDQPIVREALRKGIRLSNDTEIFLDAAPCEVVGITGSAGKTTTTSLVGAIAQAGSAARGSRVWVGGNIGSPLIAILDEVTSDDLAVMEISSFQLELMDHSPQVAAVLNLTPNHLDRHGTMEVYRAIKARILDFQSTQDIAILCRDDPGSWEMTRRIKGKLVSFGLQPSTSQPGTYVHDSEVVLWDGVNETVLFPVSIIQLRGQHNLLNVLAACAIAYAAGFSAEAMREGVEGFKGIPHRLEFIRTWGGAEWYNDSIATAPERAMAAIRAFDAPLVLLAGGRDKNLPWDDFARLVQKRVDHLILFGEAGRKIAQVFGESYPLEICKGLREAVLAAAQTVQPGDVVLLSPGGTSFDEFRDFEERGLCFKQLVMQL